MREASDAELKLASMRVLSRRVLITGASATGAMLGLAGCASTPTRLTDVDPAYRRADVQYATREPRGTIVVDPPHLTSTTWRAVDKLGVMELPSAAKDLAGPVSPWSTASRNGRTDPTNEILERHPELKAGLQVGRKAATSRLVSDALLNSVLVAENGKVRIDTTTRFFCCVPVCLTTRTRGRRFARLLTSDMHRLVLLIGVRLFLTDYYLFDRLSETLFLQIDRNGWCRRRSFNG